MTDKRRDSRGRILRNGEVRRPDGRYMYRYTDMGGNRQTVYSWKLVETDAVPNGKQCKEALRDMEKRIQRDLEDHILTVDANTTTVDDLFGSFMRVRIDLKETTRCNYITLYHIHVSPTLASAKLKLHHLIENLKDLWEDMWKTEILRPLKIKALRGYKKKRVILFI